MPEVTKHALITGASRGIGGGIALALAESGIHIVIQVQRLIRDWHALGWPPMRRLGTPKDLGDVVALLCSEKSR